jgi:hypothetical protein
MVHDPILIKNALKALDEARAALAAIPKERLSFAEFTAWRKQFNVHMSKAEKYTGALIVINAGEYTGGYQTETDTDVLDVVRNRILRLLDRNIGTLDATRIPVKPELEQLTAKVTNAKLKALLVEFQGMQASQPNSAAIVLRTILCLIIKERARKHAPHLKMAQNDDLNFAADLETAVKERIFDSGELKLLDGFNRHGLKPLYDNITHKASDNWLINDAKDLTAGIELITKLLYAIV